MTNTEIKNFCNHNFFRFVESSFFNCRTQPASNAYESKGLSVVNIPYFCRTQLRKPIFGLMGKFITAFIFTGSDYNATIWKFMSLNKIIDIHRRRISIVYLCRYYLANYWINNNHMQPPTMTLEIFLKINLYIIYNYFCAIFTFKS